MTAWDDMRPWAHGVLAGARADLVGFGRIFLSRSRKMAAGLKASILERWPTGRSNGLRIVGISFRIDVDVLCWRLAMGTWDGKAFCAGPFRIWLSWNYEPRWRREGVTKS